MHKPTKYASAPRLFAQHRARGRKLSLFLLLLATIAAYVGWILMTPRVLAYEMANAMKQVCIVKMRETQWQTPEDSQTWPREWERRSRALVGGLNKNQWQFTVSTPCDKKCSCVGEVIFERETPWEIIGDFIDLKPYKTTHRRKVDVEYRARY
jgi:hypothetical protein